MMTGRSSSLSLTALPQRAWSSAGRNTGITRATLTRYGFHLTVASGTDIVINRDPDVTDAHDDVYVTIRDAFKAARRQLQDLAGKRH